MSNWHPKPLRPKDPNPLFQMNEEFVIKSDETPIQRQRRLDGTPHTKGGPTRFGPGTVEPVGDYNPPLYIGKSISDDGEHDPVPPGAETKKSIDPDAVVKSFMKGSYGASPHDAGRAGISTKDEADDELSDTPSTSAQTIGSKGPSKTGSTAGKKVGGAIKTAGKIAGRAARAVASVVPTSGR